MNFDFRFKNEILDALNNENEDLLLDLRSKMIDTFIVILFAIISLVVTLSVVRMFSTGWMTIYAVHLFLLTVFALLVVFRKHIPMQYKVYFLILLFFLAAMVGILKFGLSTQASGLFTLGVLLATIFIGHKAVIATVLIDVSFLLLITVLVSTGVYTFNIDFNTYNYNTSAWISLTLAHMLLVSLIAFTISRLIYTLAQLIRLFQQRNKELLLSKKELEQASTIKSEFLANMSHEIRTPMSAILGFVEQLAKTENDPARQRQFDIIQSSGQSLLMIINDILDLSKIESGKLRLEIQSCDTQELFSQIQELYHSYAKQKDILFDILISPSLPNYINIDSTRTKQIVHNLLNNAFKFTHKGGVVSLQVEFNEQTQDLEMSVTDNGIGIAADHMEKIFYAFEQADNTTTRRFGGTGLGLSITYRLLELMKGTINVTSQIDIGSSFSITIPITLGTQPLELTNTTPFNKKRVVNGVVLIVEDNKTNQLLLSLILDQLGATYHIANDGEEAVALFLLNRYGLIFMDENMPNMNGIEATHEIRRLEQESNKKRTPIVALTANALANDKERFIHAGMDEYIAKPYKEQDIKDALLKFNV